MVDTLREIRLEEGDLPVALLLGQDAVNALDSWHQWQQLFALAHIVIMRRPDSTHVYSGALFKEVQPRLIRDPVLLQGRSAGLVLPLEVTQLAISATDIRSQIASGKSPRFLLPDVVIKYIHEHELYTALP